MTRVLPGPFRASADPRGDDLAGAMLTQAEQCPTLADSLLARLARGEGADPLAAAWLSSCFERERVEGMMAASVAAFLVPCWTFLDVPWEPALVPWAGWLRLGFSLLNGGLFALLLRTRRLAAVRVLTQMVYLSTSLTVAVMVASVERHYFLYVSGYSLIFWAAGVSLSVPVRQMLVLVASSLGIFVLAHAAGLPREAGVFVPALVCMLCVAVIAVAMAAMRLRLQQQAFVLAWDARTRNRELQEALDALRQTQARLVASEKLSLLGRVLAGLSHELNNPVNVILNNVPPTLGYLDAIDAYLVAAQASERQLPDGGEALRAQRESLDFDFARGDLRSAIGAVGDAAARVAGLHASLRAFVRGTVAEGAPGAVADGLRATASLLRRTLPEHVVLEERYAPTALIAARFGELNQVWLNLLRNAFDSVGLRGRVTVEVAERHGFIEVAIADDGPGLTPQAREHLFEPFFTTKEIGKGTGLGLSMCWEIVQAHGGSIGLDVDHAPGARFVVRLPVSA